MLPRLSRPDTLQQGVLWLVPRMEVGGTVVSCCIFHNDCIAVGKIVSAKDQALKIPLKIPL